MNKYLLALDASTTEVGYAIFDKSTKQLIELSHYSHIKDKSLIEKALNYKNWLKELLIKYPQIDELVLEESLIAIKRSSKLIKLYI